MAQSTIIEAGRPRLRRRLAGGVIRLSHVVVLALIAFVVFVTLTMPPDALKVRPAARFLPPFGKTLLGTDHLGRDLAALIAVGLRTSLLIALAVVLLAALIGWFLGAASAYIGGRFDSVLSRVMDVFNVFPALVFAIALTAALGPSLPVLIVVLVLGTWVNYARVIRAAVLSLKSREYMQASHMYGARLSRVLFTHVWPNTSDLLLSVALAQIANVILSESTLSFLGFGLQAPAISLGLLIATEKDYLQTNGYPVLVAGFVLVLTCSALAGAALSFRSGRR